jgi:hypothetical protein
VILIFVSNSSITKNKTTQVHRSPIKYLIGELNKYVVIAQIKFANIITNYVALIYNYTASFLWLLALGVIKSPLMVKDGG